MREKEVNRIAQMYLKYLNGPLGKGVMDHLKEGESFTVRAHEELICISKQKGQATVQVLEGESHTGFNTRK